MPVELHFNSTCVSEWLRAELPVSLGNLIRTAVSVLLGVSNAVRLRLIQREATGYGDHPRLKSGKLGVSHVAEPFRYRIGRKMQIQRLRWTAITAGTNPCLFCYRAP